MFQFFRINDPYRLFFVFVLALAIRIVFLIVGEGVTVYEFKWLLLGERLGDGFVMYREAFDYTGPLASGFYKYLDLIFGRSAVAHQVIASIILFVNAALFNLILVRNRAYDENNFVPALIFVLLGSALPDLSALSPQLMASFFVIMSLNNVLRRIDNQLGEELFLHSGLYLGVAGLFYLPSVLFFFLFLVAFILFSSAKSRRIVLYVYGLLLPFLVAYGYFAWLDGGAYFLEMYLGRINDPVNYFLETKWAWMIAGFLAFWLLVGFYGAFFRSRQNNYESRILQIMILFVISTVLIILLDRELSLAQFVLFIPPISYFLTYYFLAVKKLIWRAIMPVLFLGTCLAAPYVMEEAADRSFGELPYNVPFGSKLLVTTDDLTVYRPYDFTSPFIDQYLSQTQMKRLDYYDSAMDLYYAIEKDKPLYIVDKLDLMPLIFERFPDMGEAYVRTGFGYRLNK